MTKRKAYLQQKLKLVPKNPGVYIMYDAKGSVIYVGKAIKLKNRLQCYFGDNRSQPSLKVAMMIAKIYDFQYIICQNEQEALILESNLIKRHQPFYNILLKDDHDYPYIKVSLNESWPRVTKAYRVGSDRAFGAKYYGPYLNSQLQMALRSLEQIFPLASCDPSKLKRFVPCLNYQIGKCIGTCCKVATRDDYLKVIERVCKYLNGDTQGVLSYLTEAMNEAASQGKFEQAAFFRDRLFALKALHATQRIVSQQAINLDVLAICQQNLLYCIQKLEIRQGKITGASNFFISVEDLSYSLFGSDEKLPDVDASSNMQTDKAISKEVALLPNKSTGNLASLTEDEQSVTALLELFFSQHYAEIDNKPPNILLANSLNESILAQLKRDFIAITGQKCNFEQAKRGERYEWGKLALNNAREALSKKLLMLGSKISNRETALLSLQKLNNLKTIPHRIEAYDVANLGNDDLCAAMVCFIDGVYTPKNSLLFKLPNQNQQDDYLAMSTVLVRRLKHLATLEAVNSLAKPGAMELLKKADNLESEPDLILLDGGRGHQQAVLKALEQNFNWSRQSISKRLKIAGMVKNDKHETRALLTAEGEQLELMPALNVERKGTDIFLTSQNGTKQSTEEAVNLLRLLTKVQDEVHRLANDYYRKLQKKRILHYELQDIPGIGPKKCQLLLKHFKSTEAVKLASVAELEQVKGISHNNAEKIYEYYRLRQ